ncbi:hypothetical protein CIPAW_03G167900 [Carya illinoinensis]|uniref:Uncharacterized protein n=1 Tax=Carya illinoinensis TaxID=32201 RepID=A0A8T1R4Q6_CARIL|nr:hypothetical protein CIPAW_03G167900 [Carya illinoinensis]
MQKRLLKRVSHRKCCTPRIPYHSEAASDFPVMHR